MGNDSKSIGLKNGLLFGMSAITFGLILYTINKQMFLNPSLRFILSLVLPITFMIKGIRELRNFQGGFISFQGGLQASFLTFVIGATLFTLFQSLILSFDSELLEIQHRIGLESLESIANLANLSEEQLANMRDSDPKTLKPTLSGTLFKLSGHLIVGFIMAVILSLIHKRTQ